MTDRLNEKKPDYDKPREFLQTVWYESRRAGLDVSLVLGFIETMSDFRSFHVSERGARGYMAVMPYWSLALGDGDESKLFQAQTNLRFGCVVLRHYLDKRQDDLRSALRDYIENSVGVAHDSRQAFELETLIYHNQSKWMINDQESSTLSQEPVPNLRALDTEAQSRTGYLYRASQPRPRARRSGRNKGHSPHLSVAHPYRASPLLLR